VRTRRTNHGCWAGWDPDPDAEPRAPEADWSAGEALDVLPDAPDPVEAALAPAGDPADVPGAAADPPPAPVTAWVAEPAAEVALDGRLVAVGTSDCSVLEAALVTPWSAEGTAPVALETAEPAPEVAEDTVEPRPEVTFGSLGGVTEGSPEATLIEAPMPMAASSVTVRAAATMNDRPGMRTKKRLYRSICWNNAAGRENFRLYRAPEGSAPNGC
jgi:hypothetical protein